MNRRRDCLCGLWCWKWAWNITLVFFLDVLANHLAAFRTTSICTPANRHLSSTPVAVDTLRPTSWLTFGTPTDNRSYRSSWRYMSSQFCAQWWILHVRVFRKSLSGVCWCFCSSSRFVYCSWTRWTCPLSRRWYAVVYSPYCAVRTFRLAICLSQLFHTTKERFWINVWLSFLLSGFSSLLTLMPCLLLEIWEVVLFATLFKL